MKVIIFRERSLKEPYQIRGEIIACGNLITGNLQNELDLIFTMSRNLFLPQNSPKSCIYQYLKVYSISHTHSLSHINAVSNTSLHERDSNSQL
jgi:hypothetical protein